MLASLICTGASCLMWFNAVVANVQHSKRNFRLGPQTLFLPPLVRPFFQLPPSNPQPRTSSAVPTTQVESDVTTFLPGSDRTPSPYWFQVLGTALPPISH